MINSIIGSSTILKGEFEVQGNLRIDGAFEGVITGSGSVLIGQTGSANADLTAKEIIVGGTLEGNINVVENVLVLSTGCLKGSIQARSFEVEPGGIILGRCKIHKKKDETKDA